MSEASSILFERYDPSDERRREALLALGDGVLHSRAAAAEARADGIHYPGTYRAGFYDRQESQVAGQRVCNVSLVNLPNWLPLSFRFEGADDWFLIDRVAVERYRQALDFDTAVVERALTFGWKGRRTQLLERRLIGASRPALAWIEWSLTPLDWSGRIEICSGLDAAVENRNVRKHQAYAARHFADAAGEILADGAVRLSAQTLQSRRRVALTARTELAGARLISCTAHLQPGWAGERLVCDAQPGETLRVSKTVTYDFPDDLPAHAAVPAAETIVGEHIAAWAPLWRCAAPRAQGEFGRNLRFHAFRLLQTLTPATARVDAGLPARGLEEFYNGQIFWDDIVAFPFLVARFPKIARGLLLYRWRRLGQARRAAREAGLAGAMFPWRSADTGEEETPALQHDGIEDRWVRDHTHLQRHVGSAIALNIWRYAQATGDEAFLGHEGGEMLVEIARFWTSLACEGASGRYDIRGVVGPDEFHTCYPGADRPGVDNNAYTNVMAAWVLTRALELCERLDGAGDGAAVRFGVTDAERRRWEAVSRGLNLPFSADGVLLPHEGFDRLKPLDRERLARARPGLRTDWALDDLRDDVNRYQVLKQPDTLMLFYLFDRDELRQLVGRMGYALAEADARHTLERQLAWTTHESSLSQIVCAGALARYDRSASWRLFQAALGVDLDQANSQETEQGPHLGAMAASLDLVQRIYLGLELGETLRTAPNPPAELAPIGFDITHRGARLSVNWRAPTLQLSAASDNDGPVDVTTPQSRARLQPGETLTVATDTLCFASGDETGQARR